MDREGEGLNALKLGGGVIDEAGEWLGKEEREVVMAGGLESEHCIHD